VVFTGKFKRTGGVVLTQTGMHAVRIFFSGLLGLCALLAAERTLLASPQEEDDHKSKALLLHAPAGNLPATRNTTIDGFDAAVLPNGRIITPAGVEVSVSAPKPYGMALSPDGKTLATVNSGSGPFSITLVTDLETSAPGTLLIPVNATFMGVVWAPDSQHFYASGGENGSIWVGDAKLGQIVGSVNLNGPTHPLTGPLDPTKDPPGRFLGTYPGRMALSSDGRFLYVVDQGGFQVHVVDTSKIVTGIDAKNLIVEPNNFAAVAGAVKVGHYPFGIALSQDGKSLYVSHVGIFQYTSLAPSSPTGDPNKDFPLAYPGTGYPDDVKTDKTITIHKVDPNNLPPTQRIPDGIRTGYIEQNSIQFTIPALGDPNAPESSSVYVLDISNPVAPTVKKIVKTGPLVGEVEHGIETFGGSHPNAVVVGSQAIYVANGNNDSISILDKQSFVEVGRVHLTVLEDFKHIKGVQPISLTLSPDGHRLYVAEAGINAVGVLQVEGKTDLDVLGHIPVGAWPSSVAVSADGKTLYVANARGRGAGPNNEFPPDNLGSPKFSDLGSVSIVPVPSSAKLSEYTHRVLANNGFVETESEEKTGLLSGGEGGGPIRHVIFINKENSTFDQTLGDLTISRKNVPINGEPNFSLGPAASPNHHELALQFTVGDNFFLEPNVSSDGHRWLTDTYPTEFEDTHWPASYGGERTDSGDNPQIFVPYPGRLGFTDANGSSDPEDYDQHGSIFLHLSRNHRSFVNFGNGYEFALVDESQFEEPTGIRQHVNVPMEKVLRDNSDHLYPEFNTSIPDAPLAEQPTRFSRFGRFKQVFQNQYVDQNSCKLPNYVDLYFPNNHGGGPFDIHPNGPAWSYQRFIQDNDDALGLTVELISHSPCWKDTVIFVVEDDPQNGFDHVDGSRAPSFWPSARG
jgi:DNA-binding beta-propeller fold protein YncE